MFTFALWNGRTRRPLEKHVPERAICCTVADKAPRADSAYRPVGRSVICFLLRLSQGSQKIRQRSARNEGKSSSRLSLSTIILQIDRGRLLIPPDLREGSLLHSLTWPIKLLHTIFCGPGIRRLRLKNISSALI